MSFPMYSGRQIDVGTMVEYHNLRVDECYSTTVESTTQSRLCFCGIKYTRNLQFTSNNIVLHFGEEGPNPWLPSWLPFS